MMKAWQKPLIENDHWACLEAKLNTCKQSIGRWRNSKQQPSHKKLHQMREQLAVLQGDEGTFGGEEMQKLQSDIHVLLDKEDLRWHQRARIDWLKFGDRNTKFFHVCANARRQRNFIGVIHDVQGVKKESTEGVKEAFVHYFSKLFTAGQVKDMTPYLRHLSRCVTQDMNTELLRDFTMEEIRDALRQMAPLKAPGLDGLNACFYQTNWTILGDEVCKSVLSILNYGIMPMGLNLTHITLIPKKKNPTNVTEFRPISLCNVMYKLISKTLANRLKRILTHIISPLQSAFILGRLITDNVLAAYETLHTMHTGMKGKKGFMAIKLDMSKAYDWVGWRFLEAVMECIGFG